MNELVEVVESTAPDGFTPKIVKRTAVGVSFFLFLLVSSRFFSFLAGRSSGEQRRPGVGLLVPRSLTRAHSRSLAPSLVRSPGLPARGVRVADVRVHRRLRGVLPGHKQGGEQHCRVSLRFSHRGVGRGHQQEADQGAAQGPHVQVWVEVDRVLAERVVRNNNNNTSL